MKTALWFALGIFFGWIFAHQEISSECRYQGNFYVGTTTYECGVKDGK